MHASHHDECLRASHHDECLHASHHDERLYASHYDERLYASHHDQCLHASHYDELSVAAPTSGTPPLSAGLASQTSRPPRGARTTGATGVGKGREGTVTSGAAGPHTPSHTGGACVTSNKHVGVMD